MPGARKHASPSSWAEAFGGEYGDLFAAVFAEARERGAKKLGSEELWPAALVGIARELGVDWALLVADACVRKIASGRPPGSIDLEARWNDTRRLMRLEAVTAGVKAARAARKGQCTPQEQVSAALDASRAEGGDLSLGGESGLVADAIVAILSWPRLAKLPAQEVAFRALLATGLETVPHGGEVPDMKELRDALRKSEKRLREGLASARTGERGVRARARLARALARGKG